MIAKAIDRLESLDGYLKEYHYQPELTRKLDHVEDKAFTQELVNEIVLWKVNRYAGLPKQTLASIDSLTSIAPGDHRQAKDVILALLDTRDVDLAMASTLLRFRNPHAFQIIDRHAYRAVYGESLKLYTQTANARKIDVYFGYLDKLRELASLAGVAFEDLDRMLYQFDKRLNGTLDAGD